MLKNLLFIPIKSLLIAAILLALVNLFYFGYTYFQADFEGVIGYDIKKFVLTLNEQGQGLIWGEQKTYGFAGFLFVIVLIREWLKGGLID